MQVRSLGQEDSPGGGYGNPLQYSRLGNPMDRGAWWAIVHGGLKSQTQLSNWTTTIKIKQYKKIFINTWIHTNSIVTLDFNSFNHYLANPCLVFFFFGFLPHPVAKALRPNSRFLISCLKYSWHVSVAGCLPWLLLTLRSSLSQQSRSRGTISSPWLWLPTVLGTLLHSPFWSQHSG